MQGTAAGLGAYRSQTACPSFCQALLLVLFSNADYYTFEHGFVQLILVQCEVVYSVFFLFP